MSKRLDLNQERPIGRVCSNCGKRIPMSQSNGMCVDCQKILLFPAVKEYVRENDVNELELAEHFDLDRDIIRDWLREGRLEHKR